MKDWKDISVTRIEPIQRALEILNRSGAKIVLVTDEHQKLIGTITDGDIRRGLLKGIQINQSVDFVMNVKPLSLPENSSRSEIIHLMREKSILQIPLIDTSGKICEVITLDEYLRIEKKENEVLLLAGGLGSRLSSLTANCPKSMLKIGNKPILETIIETFRDQGYHNFCLCVNYLSNVIVDHFKDGSEIGVKIRYIKEEKRLGTAGPLSLHEPINTLPIIVMNADLLTKINFNDLIKFHQSHSNDVTVCLRQYDVQIPFGVVSLENDRIKEIQEKPTKNYFVSSGIYVFKPEVLKYVPGDSFYDMPTFLEDLIKNNRKVGGYPFYDYWIDIGRIDDYEKAHNEFLNFFS